MDIKLEYCGDEDCDDVCDFIKVAGFHSQGYGEDDKTGLCIMSFIENSGIVDLQTLQRVRNKLSRRIATLKKADLKDEEETELATCVFCGEVFNSIYGRSDCGCHNGDF